MSTFLKQVSKPINTKQEIQTLTNVNGTGLTFTFCDRTDLTDKRSNYFMSFNLPYQNDYFGTGNTLSLSQPELQQLNVDQIVLGNIDASYYNELIDGRSISFSCPQYSGLTSLSAKTLISSTYRILTKTQESDLLGSNIAFLFCDEINKPYTGTTSGGTIQKSATSWNSSVSYVQRPAATSYLDLQTIDINTDIRTSIDYAVTVPNGYPTNTNQGYNYDIPVGFVALDKGFFVLTHPEIVNNIPFELGTKIDGTPNVGPTSATTDIYFTSITKSNASFVDLDIRYKASVICYIMPKEFYKSTNPSWDIDSAIIEENNNTNGFEPIYISEIALHNLDNEIIAYAKLDKPIEKTYTDFMAFTIDLNV